VYVAPPLACGLEIVACLVFVAMEVPGKQVLYIHVLHVKGMI
jgi:hypothetical protein